MSSLTFAPRDGDSEDQLALAARDALQRAQEKERDAVAARNELKLAQLTIEKLQHDIDEMADLYAVELLKAQKPLQGALSPRHAGDDIVVPYHRSLSDAKARIPETEHDKSIRGAARR